MELGKDFVPAGLETDRVTVNGATATWEKLSPVTSFLSLDPIMFTDSHGRTLYALAGACSLSSFTTMTATSTRVQSAAECLRIDHQTIAAVLSHPVWSAVAASGGYQHAIFTARKM